MENETKLGGYFRGVELQGSPGANGKLAQLESMIEDRLEQAVRLDHRLSQLRDRLLGPVPEGNSPQSSSEDIPPAVNRLFSGLVKLENTLESCSQTMIDLEEL